ncbi:MAG: hypothetical protein ACI4ES_01490, partial [Roseburia sp.]
ELFRKLQSEGIETWIYTTSFRTEKYIRHLFGHYGIKVGQIINGSRHMKEVQARKKEPMPSKYPAKYRIDLHIDDDSSVMQNGKVYGFRVFLVGPPDDEWGDKILQEAMRIKYITNQTYKLQSNSRVLTNNEN